LISPQGPALTVERMGITTGELILEVGFDQDCDAALREQVIAKSGQALLKVIPTRLSTQLFYGGETAMGI